MPKMKESKTQKIKMRIRDILHSKPIFYLKQLFPFSYWSKYEADGKTYTAMWRQWLGLAFDYMAYEVNK